MGFNSAFKRLILIKNWRCDFFYCS